jgi:AraC-like DNA-binding protein
VRSQSAVTAWDPGIAGISEVFHAHFRQHAYPVHTHTAWTLLILDDGLIRYDLDRREHDSGQVVLLPPHVPHTGRTAAPTGFRKRVLYLTEDVLGPDLIGRATDRPTLPDPRLRDRIARLHDALAAPGDDLEVESRLALIADRLDAGLRRTARPGPPPDRGLADELRDLLDARLVDGLPLAEAARLLHADPTHLVRAFTRRFAIPPHRYLTGRRVELARGLLLAGRAPAAVATAAGFYDQSHLTRHFRRMLGVSPARFATR